MSSILSKLINLAGNITGTLGVGNGGTGAATLASNGVLYGNGTSAVQALAVNASGTNEFLTQSSSGAPAWNTIQTADVPLVKNGYYGNTPATWTGSVSLSNNGNTGLVLSNQSTDGSYITSSAVSGATLTVTFARAGWYRCSGSLLTASSAGLTALFLRHSYTNNSSSSVIVYPNNSAAGTVTYTEDVNIAGSQDGQLCTEIILHVTAPAQTMTFFTSVTASFASGTSSCFGGFCIIPL